MSIESQPPTPDDRDPCALDADERAMAERLAVSAPQREPSAALDARILAAARQPADAATSASPATAAPATAPPAAAMHSTAAMRARPSLRRRRWPAMAGIAATLVLAFGIAWQLRPVDEVRTEVSEAPRPGAPAGARRGGPQADAELEAAAGRAVAAPASVTDRAAKPQADTVAAAPAADAGAEAQDSSASAESKRASADAVEQSAPSEPPIVFDMPSPMDTPMDAPVAPAPPPPPAPAASTARPQQGVSTPPEPAESAAADESPRRERRDAAAEADAATRDKAQDSRALDSIDVTGSRIERYDDQPLDDQPPASADAPQVREAWLGRIRELLGDGRVDAARDSLREYRRRYPDAPIPDDLQPLLSP